MLTILIVDDNPTFRMQAARLCEAEGFRTITAGSVSDLATVLSSGAAPDLVLIDIELPQIPGHRLGTLIRARSNVPIVLVSALSEDRVRRMFEASDANGWICKPLTRDKLIGAVTRFVQHQGAAAATVPEMEEPSAQTRVLLIEDEPVIAARIEAALAPRCAVTTVADGDSAIQHLVRGRYDCLLLDLTLPHLSGFDVLRHLILHKPEMLQKTIIMTAATDESLQFIDRNSVAGVLRKPFEVGALPEMVQRLV